MTKLQKTLFIAVAVLTACMMSICASLYHAIYIEPGEIAVNYQMIKNKKIPKDRYDVSIVYFTDLEYGKFQDQKRTDALFKKIEELHPDILIFGGDLFDAKYKTTDQDRQAMIDRFAALPASLGKFAVIGEQDLVNEERQTLVYDIYANSQVEVVDNSTRFLGNRSKSGIQLIGLRTDADFNQALANVDDTHYNLLVSHYADHLRNDALKNVSISYALAGNSHGTQILYPILGGYRKYPGNEKLNRDNGANLPFPYYISAGTGCIHVNARLNATPEIVYLIFSR